MKNLFRATMSLIRMVPWVFFIVLIVVPLAIVFAMAGGVSSGSQGFDRLPGVFLFTLVESLASALFALFLGLGGAWLLGTKSFRGRGVLGAITVIPFMFPTVLFLFGYLGIFGTNGIISNLIVSLGGTPFYGGYGFWGIVIAHALFNFPVVIGIVGPAWSRLPISIEHAGALLGAKPSRVFFTLTLPSLMPAIMSAFLISFLFCFMSFTIPLNVGGGPQFETIEVFIYNSFYSTPSNPGLSAFAGIFELATCIGLLLVYNKVRTAIKSSYDMRPLQSFKSSSLRVRVIGRFTFFLSLFLALLPLIGLIDSSLKYRAGRGTAVSIGFDMYAKILSNPETYSILLNGIFLAVLVAGLSIVYSWFISSFDSAKRSWRAVIFSAPLGISVVLLSLGWKLSYVSTSSLVLLVFVQLILTYPLAYRAILNGRMSIPENYLNMARLLGSSDFFILRNIELPLMKPILFSSVLFCVGVSLGDVNIPLMLGISDFDLPALHAYKLIGAHGFGEARAFGVITLVIIAIIFIVSRKLGEDNVV